METQVEKTEASFKTHREKTHVAGKQLIVSNQVDTLQVVAQQDVFNGSHNYSQHGSISGSGDVDVDLPLFCVGFLGQSSEPALEVIAASPRVT